MTQPYCWYRESFSGLDRSNRLKVIKHFLSQSLIKTKAQGHFNYTKAESGEESAEEKLEANRDWFIRFQERTYIYNKSTRWRTSSDVGAATRYPEDLANMIIEGSYIKEQIFNVDEMPYTEGTIWLGLS